MSDLIEVVTDAILRPSQPGEKRGMRQRCGVFDQQRQAVGKARISARLGALSLPCTCPDPRALPRRMGRWLYGGVGYYHFGHALIFSTSRLWALDHLDEPVDGILFIDRDTGGQTRTGTTRHLERQMQMLGIDLPVWTVAEPEVVEELVVPAQGISTDDALFAGLPEYRDYIRGVIAHIPDADATHPRVYISRRKLGIEKPGLMFEDRLESYLEAAGYMIFHPQEHPLETQISLYKGASHIIGVDGSAMHLAAFTAQPSAKVAVLARRAFYAEAFAEQVRAFSGAEGHAITAYDTVYAPEPALRDGTLWFRTLCQTRFPALGAHLTDLGFVDDAAHWKTPIRRRIDRRLARAERRLKQKLVPVPEALRAKEPGAK